MAEPPQAFGIDAAFKKLQHHLDLVLEKLRRDMQAGFRRLERIEQYTMAQLDDMNTKLENIANSETQLGQSIQQVVDYLKNNPNPTDLSQQLASLDAIAQKLIDTNAQTLSNLPPTPPPDPLPSSRRRP